MRTIPDPPLETAGYKPVVNPSFSSRGASVSFDQFPRKTPFISITTCLNGCVGIIFTARRRSLGKGNIFAPVCHSVRRGGAWSQGSAWSQGGAWSWGGGLVLGVGCLVLGGGIWSRPTTRGEVEGDLVQAVNQGGN